MIEHHPHRHPHHLHHLHHHPLRSSIVIPSPGSGGRSAISRAADEVVSAIGTCLFVVGLVVCAFFAVSLLSDAMAFAADVADDGGALGVTAVDSGWSLFAAYGPLWGSISVAYPFVRHLLSINQSKHWIAEGRTLAALTGLAAVLGTVIQWHFAGAPASGVLAAIVGAIALVWHPTVPVTPKTAKDAATLTEAA